MFDVTEQTISVSESNQTLKSYLELKTEDQLKLKNTITDQLGTQHDRYDQFYKNVKVEYGSFKGRSY